MSIADLIRDAGVIGAGGAGFPTNVKMSGKADIVLGNGAECEPLLRVDRLMMQHYPDKIVRGMKAVMESTGAKQGVLCLKKKYKEAASALEGAIRGEENIRLFRMDNYYPAGDEQQMVYEVTGRVVPTGGIPLDVGAVVNNVSTLMHISDALNGKPVTDKYVTVAGEVKRPITIKVPVGTPIVALIAAAGGPDTMDGYTLIIGGPATGKLCSDWSEPVTKTTGGIIVLRSDHPLIRRKTGDDALDARLAKAVCCQCNMCTQLCPRNALGLGVEPHKAMRAAFMNDGKLLGDVNGIFSCCDCGLCTYYACNFGLSPSRMMTRLKEGLMRGGIKPEKRVRRDVSDGINAVKVPTSRLMARMGISQYDKDTVLHDTDIPVRSVKLPLKMHIGAPSIPVVQAGDMVWRGQLVADIPEGSLGAKIHASITGRVTEVTDAYIGIRIV
jgi:Na+-translocating ferredoxin:NAD+ oxidoreductase RnfC subunit